MPSPNQRAAILLDQWNTNGLIVGDPRHRQSYHCGGLVGLLRRPSTELLGRQALKLGISILPAAFLSSSGPPNVGKSSLINALSLVTTGRSSCPAGTTRDAPPFQLQSAAGRSLVFLHSWRLRETQDELEAAGIALATNTLSRADLAIYVRDAAKLHYDALDEENPREQRTLAACVPSVPTIQVVNKIDLIPESGTVLQLLQFLVDSQPDIGQSHVVSALNGGRK